jgi:glutathione S-transferase
MALKLYDSPESMCAQKVRLVLAEKRLEYNTHVVDMVSYEQISESYLSINANGVVPSLDHDGAILNNSSAIAEYIDDVFPDPPLSPSDKIDRAHMRTWMRFFEEITTPAARWPSWHYIFIPMVKSSIGMQYISTLASRQPHHSHFYKQMAEDGLPKERLKEAEQELRRTFMLMNKGMSDNRKFLVSDGVTLADFIVLPLVVRAQDAGLGALWSDLPHVTLWLDQMRSRDSFSTVFSNRMPNVSGD